MMKNEMNMLRVFFIAPLYDSGHSYSFVFCWRVIYMF